MDTSLEDSLVKLINEELFYLDINLDKYQKVEFSVFSDNIIKDILHTCKFKDIGNIYDYPDSLPQPTSIDGFDLVINYELLQKIAVSKKFNSVVLYTIDRYRINCIFLIDNEYLKKFSKSIKPILQKDSKSNTFKGVDFRCKGNEYIEIGNAEEDSVKPAEILKKKVNKEKLVFVKDSILMDVMNDINMFFKPDTHKMYDKMQIIYKRGIILYGDPGNGKSAMIREIIRTIPKVSKILVNPGINNITVTLSALIKALDGKQSIIIIEDIDSLISNRNRSEFLNVLDGVDIKSGIYFIGTTNYPDKIDPAFMNRSGRFDRTFKIDNPDDAVRYTFFKDRKIGELLSEYKVYKDDSKPDSDEGTIELFVKYSNDLPMASLKEIMTSTKYLLASNTDMSIEEAVEKSYNTLITNKNDHIDKYNNYQNELKFRRADFGL